MLLVGGENLIDMFNDKTSTASEYHSQPSEFSLRACLGGSPFNTAIAAGLMGAKVAYLSSISTDHFGDSFMSRLAAANVRHFGGRVEEPTSLAIVTLIAGSPAYRFYREGTAERCVDESKLMASLDEATMLHIGSLALAGERDGEIWRSIYEIAHQRGVFTSVDLNIRPLLIEDEEAYRERLMKVMLTSKLIKFSDEDLMWWAGDDTLYDRDAAIKYCESLLKTFTPDLLILTRGAEGAILWVRVIEEEVYHHHIIKATPPSTLQDTVGAGDTFMGSFLQQYQAVNYLKNGAPASVEDFITACEVASYAAAINVERVGCQPPKISELVDRLKGEDLSPFLSESDA